MSKNKDLKKNNQVTETQHYVPKFYLKRFSDAQQFLSVLEVKEMKLLPRRPFSSVCYSSFYYGMKTGLGDEPSQQIEELLRKAEGWISNGIAKTIERVLTQQRISGDDKYLLSVLFSMLWGRGPRMRKQIARFQESMMKQIMKLTGGHAVDNYVEETEVGWTEERKNKIKRFFTSGEYNLDFDNGQHLLLMIDTLGLHNKGYANLFFQQNWRIYIARGVSRFITSDSPVVEWLPPRRGFFGIAFPDRSHYLALTPEILIELTTPSDSHKVRRTTLFSDKDDVVKMFNLLIANYSHQYAYSVNQQDFSDMLSEIEAPGPVLTSFCRKFEVQKIAD